MSAQDRPSELKLVSLEPSDNEDSEYVIKIVLPCLWTKQQRKRLASGGQSYSYKVTPLRN